jgi:hypothetical protein
VVKNFNLKSLVLSSLFKTLYQRNQETLHHSSSFFSVLLKASNAEWANGDDRSKHLQVVLKHLNHLSDNRMLVLGEANMAEFDKFMQNAFVNQHKEKKESMKVEILQTLRKLVGEFYNQIVKGIEDPVIKLEKSRLVTFMPDLT